MTPSEVFHIANAVGEREAENIKMQAWLTASLTGANKVPPYDVVFKKADRVLEAKNENDIRMAFASAGAFVKATK